jgi:hypothetical protein
MTIRWKLTLGDEMTGPRDARTESFNCSGYMTSSMNLRAAGRFSSQVGPISLGGRMKPPPAKVLGRNSMVNEGMP